MKKALSIAKNYLHIRVTYLGVARALHVETPRPVLVVVKLSALHECLFPAAMARDCLLPLSVVDWPLIYIVGQYGTIILLY